MAFVDGFIVGLAMVFFVGPVLFTILQISLEKGLSAGFLTAIGVFVSDVVCVAICYIGMAKYLEDTTNSFWISILGAIILWSIGLKYLLKPNLSVAIINKPTTLTLAGSFFKGFLVNFVNPFVFGVWIAVIGMAQNKYESNNEIISYLFAATFAVLITDSLKVVFADRIRPYLKPKLLTRIYKFSGVALILFGIRVFAHIFQ